MLSYTGAVMSDVKPPSSRSLDSSSSALRNSRDAVRDARSPSNRKSTSMSGRCVSLGGLGVNDIANSTLLVGVVPMVAGSVCPARSEMNTTLAPSCHVNSTGFESPVAWQKKCSPFFRLLISPRGELSSIVPQAIARSDCARKKSWIGSTNRKALRNETSRKGT